MKRCLALVLVLLLWLNLAACAPSAAPTTTQPPADTTTTTTTADTTVLTTTTTTVKPTAATTVKRTTTTTVKPTTVTTTYQATTTTTTTTAKPTTPSTTAPPHVQSTPLLYEVRHENGTVAWLFGSIHLGMDSMYPLPDYVLNSLEKADSLAVEFDPTVLTENDYANELYHFIYQNGTTVADHLPTETYQAARTLLEEEGLYNPYLEYYEPYIWADTINSLLQNQLPYTADKGVDLHMIALAKQKGILVKNMESLQEQYAIFGNFSPDLQTLLLQDALATYERGYKPYLTSMTELVSAWFYGNESDLEELSAIDVPTGTDVVSKSLAEYKRYLYTDRDFGMARYVLACLENKESVFVCVGAAHINGGETGLRTLLPSLSNNQCTVTRITP